MRELPAWTRRAGGAIPGLDGLRAVSILLVLLSHLVTDRIPGGLGVYVFFVISGFLIAHLMFSEAAQTGRISLRMFYLRRALRLYPALIAFVALTVACCAAIGVALTKTDVASALFYFANYHRSRPFGILWSLSVEEHFYLVLPAVMVLSKARPKAILAAALTVCLGCLALRLAVAAAHPDLLRTEYFYARTQYRLDSIAFGVLIAAAFRTERGRDLLYRIGHPLCTLTALAVVLVCLSVRDPYFRETVRYSLLGASIAVVVTAVLFRPVAPMKLLNAAPVVWLGKLSYSLYLWHYLVKVVFQSGFPELRTAVYAPVLIPLAIALAALSYYGLELPAQALRKRLNPVERTRRGTPPPSELRPEATVDVSGSTRAAG